MKKGMLITFEGLEGCGKTTQIRRLADELSTRGLSVVKLREPGGTDLGDRIRQVLLEDILGFDASIVQILDEYRETINPVAVNMLELALQNQQGKKEFDLETEMLLFQASRAQLVTEIVKPSLEKGNLVLLDRFYDSTYAYQGFARGLGMFHSQKAINQATQGLVPDLSLLLDIDPERGLNRRSSDGKWDRLDAEALEFHQKVRYAYLTMYNHDEAGGRWRYVDASRRIDEVYSDVKRIIESELTSRGFIENIQIGKERR